eukprot:jgi/Ulvmu1/7413/UM036_0073.1
MGKRAVVLAPGCVLCSVLAQQCKASPAAAADTATCNLSAAPGRHTPPGTLQPARFATNHPRNLQKLWLTAPLTGPQSDQLQGVRRTSCGAFTPCHITAAATARTPQLAPSCIARYRHRATLRTSSRCVQ